MPASLLSRFLSLAALLLVTQAHAAANDEIDAVVLRAMEAFSVPGIAIGIVKDGQIVHARGYGARTLGKPEKVDAETLFAIGSNTKPFTTAALAMLVDEGRVGWDDKVIDHLPAFRLYDPYVTREITLRDLLSHRSGLGPGAGDLMVFPDTDFTRAEIIEGLRHLRPVSSFRSKFAYDNVLYMVGGEILAKVAGTSWEDFVQRRLIERLGMTSCSVRSQATKAITNVAAPHAIVKGEVTQVEPLDVSVVAAAGGIQCNVTGMTKWIGVQLAGGRLSDTVLFSARQQQEMWTPQTIGPVSSALTKLHGTHFRAYGLGWNLEDFHGNKRVFHSGGLLGMVSHVTLIPELNFGIVVLANQQSGEAVNSIVMHAAKSVIGVGQQDWVGMYQASMKEQRAQVVAAEDKLNQAIAAAGAPPLPASAYAGTYRDAWRGNVTVAQVKNDLVLQFSRTKRLEGVLRHSGKGVFVVRWKDRSLAADALVRFTQDFAGNISAMALQGLPTADGSFDFQDLDLQKVSR